MKIDQVAFNTADFRQLARRRLPRGVFEFVDRGSEDELALSRNVSAWRSIHLMPHQPRDVSARDTGWTLFGKRLPMPVVIGPTGAADILWYRGELALARAARAVGVPFVLATSSTTPMSTIFDETAGEMWLQVYLWNRRELSREVIMRARELGVRTLVVTIDTPVIPNREFNYHNGFTNPFRVTTRSLVDLASHPRWLCGVLGRYALTGGLPRYKNYPAEFSTSIAGKMPRLDNAANMTWADVDMIRDLWPGRLIVKGILANEDALTAREHGADAVILSNHGGRNLDTAPVPARILPRMRDHIGSDLSLLVDSGIRRGSDIVKAIALGADCTLIGKPALWALGAGGQPAVETLLRLLKDEMDKTLALIGRSSFAEVGRDALVSESGEPWSPDQTRKN